MPVNLALLERYSSFIDPKLGISEQFLRLEVGRGQTIAVLSRPIESERGIAWVLCHSFGPEQMELQPTEVHLARRLAAAGYPVLRFHCQGYGDSEFVYSNPSLGTHLRDTSDVVSQIGSIIQAPAIGLLGARFGGAVAAILADRLQVPYLVVVDPAVDGGRFTSELLRTTLVTEMTKGDQSAGLTSQDLERAMSNQQVVNVKGFMLADGSYQEMRGLDLLSLVGGYSGATLIVQISLTEKPKRSLLALAERLTALGAATSFRVVSDRFAPRFGREHMQALETNMSSDMLTDINRTLANTIIDWCSQLDELVDQSGKENG